MAVPADPPIDWFDFWTDDWYAGPASDGLAEYFDKWFAFQSAQGDAEFQRFTPAGGTAEISVWRQKTFFGDEEYVLLDRSASRSGARLRYLAVHDEESGEETTWCFLEGMTDLDAAWRRDLIESYHGNPGYETVKDTVARYWRNEYEPRLIMQIDPATLEFFYVPRERPPAGSGNE